jgi:hypothetical protein
MEKIHYKWPFSIAMLVYQRVIWVIPSKIMLETSSFVGDPPSALIVLGDVVK